jgi:hypothetical protein
MPKRKNIYRSLKDLSLRDVGRSFGNGNYFHGVAILKLLSKTLIKARRKHKEYARSKDEALRVIGSEYGELLQAVTKGEGGRREREEAAHCCATLIRFLGKEWREGELEDKMLAMLEPEEGEESSAQLASDDDAEVEWFDEDEDENEEKER